MSLAFILAVVILPGVLADDGLTTYQVGVFGAGAEELAGRLPVVAGQADNVEVDVVRVADESEASRLVESGAVDVAVGEGRIVVQRDMGDRLGILVQEANRQVVAESALAGAGVGPDVAGRILMPEPLEVRALDPESEEENTRAGVVFFGTLMLYGQLLGFGYWVASGVVEEKRRGWSRSCWPRPGRRSCWPAR